MLRASNSERSNGSAFALKAGKGHEVAGENGAKQLPRAAKPFLVSSLYLLFDI